MPHGRPRWSWSLLPIAFFALVGLFLGIGGAALAVAGGSLYYLLCGAMLLAVAALIWRRDPCADAAYAVLAAVTFGWAICESGFDPWGLMPRVAGPSLAGLLFLLPRMPRVAGRHRLTRYGWTVPVAVACLALWAGSFIDRTAFRPATDGAFPSAPRDTDWRAYGGAPDGSRHSGLAQINQATVERLRPEWVHRSGNIPLPTESVQITPLKVGDDLFTCTASGTLIALDAATGVEKWRHVPKLRTGDYANRVCRSIAYANTSQDPRCPRRVLWATVDAHLRAVDAATGQPCARFGTGGAVDLHAGLGTNFRPSDTYSTSGPVVVGNVAVIGGLVLDNQNIDMPSGVVRAFDVTTGALRWAFDMGRPTEAGAPGPRERFTPSTPNAWAPFAADLALSLVYVPMGNPSPDFFGGLRRPVDERFGSAIVALQVSDGRPRWVFQTVHHDLWDYDVPSQPSLVDLRVNGRTVRALVQPTKHGDLFVLDRATGKPLLPVRERPVPSGSIERNYSPTQPTSAIALGGSPLRERDMWGLTPLDQLACRLRFRAMDYEGDYTPPSTRPTLVFPGITGAMNWGGASVDPATGTAVINTTHIATVVQLTPRAAVTTAIANGKWQPLMVGTPYAVHQAPFMGPLGVPCNQPPWGMLTRVDLHTGRTIWSRRLGTGRDSGPLAMPFGLPLTVGVPSVGGSLTTAGGLVFIGATLDRYVRAFDQRTGAEVWRWRVPAGAQATPMTYMAKGRQYIVISVGGHALLGTKQGDMTYAFALPPDRREH